MTPIRIRGADDPTALPFRNPVGLGPAGRAAAYTLGLAVVAGVMAAVLSVLLWVVAVDALAWRAVFG